jgi:hypothetical protein
VPNEEQRLWRTMTRTKQLVPHLGVKEAIWAIAHRVCRRIWKLPHEGVAYKKQDARNHARKLPDDIFRRYRRCT